MKIEKIKPIPKYIIKRIQQIDTKNFPTANGRTRFYSYLTKNDGELVKVTVAVRHYRGKWICKQVVVHGLDSDFCIGRDMAFHYIGGYSVGWYDMGVYSRPKWFEDGIWYINDDKQFDPFAVLVNREYVAKLPEFKYSAHELFNGADIIQYLRLYQEYPQLEYLMKLGCKHLYYSKQVLRKLGKDAAFRKWFTKNREEIRSHEYYVKTVLGAYTKKITLAQMSAQEEAKNILQRNGVGYRTLCESFKDDANKLLNYIGKQNTNIATYNDYFIACNALGLDMNVPKNRFPIDFKRWHDIRVDEYKTLKAKQDEEQRKELYANFFAVAERYMGLQRNKEDFIVMIAKSPADLIHEGETLHHCVGRMNYDQKFARGETLIFFVRPKNDAKTPFVTMEYSPSKHRILQCYAKNNTKPDTAVLDFVHKKWLPYANRKIKKLAA